MQILKVANWLHTSRFKYAVQNLCCQFMQEKQTNDKQTSEMDLSILRFQQKEINTHMYR